jgi:thiamine pyrophosphate-dependent acetolactate synthase large subunit-like protein
MTRLEATGALTAWFGSSPVIASLGHPAYDLFATGDRDSYFYTWGSMGLASSIGLGLAMAQPDLRVIVLDGDGSLLMNLGSLATIGWVRPKNLVVIVWDNGLYGTTGGQETATAHGTDLTAAAKAMGVTSATTVSTLEELKAAVTILDTQPGPHVITAKVTENATVAKPPLDYLLIKRRFMASLR